MSLMKIDQESLFPSLAPLWENFFGRDLMEKAGWGSVSSVPAVNIEETPKAFEASLAAPGLQRDDFVIELGNGVLTVSSKKEEKHEEHDKKGKYTRREFKYHAFSRSFTLPEAVDADKITASYRDGILSIYLPKKETEKDQPVKQIMVK
jgi:HSP20 family protein